MTSIQPDNWRMTFEHFNQGVDDSELYRVEIERVLGAIEQPLLIRWLDKAKYDELVRQTEHPQPTLRIVRVNKYREVDDEQH